MEEEAGQEKPVKGHEVACFMVWRSLKSILAGMDSHQPALFHGEGTGATKFHDNVSNCLPVVLERRTHQYQLQILGIY